MEKKRVERGKKSKSIGDNTRKTTEEFIHDAKLTHGSFYDYSLVNYTRNNAKVTIISRILSRR